MSKKYTDLIKISYNELKSIKNNIKKPFSVNLEIKGTKTEFDSVDIITYLTILEKNLKHNKFKNPNFLDEKFFFKFNKIDMKKILLQIKKHNE